MFKEQKGHEFFLNKRGHSYINIIFGLTTMHSDYFKEITHSSHIFC